MKTYAWFGVLIVFALVLFVIPQMAIGEDAALKKRKLEAVEKFMVSNRESDGDYTSVNLRDWQRKVGIPQISGEELIRKVLAVFDEYYKNLEILDYLVVYTNKPGPSGGIEYDFLIIRHETKPIKTYRFAKKKTDGGEMVQVE